MAFWNDAVVIGELAFNELGHKLHATKTELGLVVGKLHVDGAFGIAEQTLHFEHGFAGQDHFLFVGHIGVQCGRSKSQTVTIGGHQRQLLAFGHKQNTIEVVTNVVHGHGKRHLAEQLLQRFLRYAEHRAKAGSFLHQRKIFGGQCLQCEFGFAALQNQFALA